MYESAQTVILENQSVIICMCVSCSEVARYDEALTVHLVNILKAQEFTKSMHLSAFYLISS